MVLTCGIIIPFQLGGNKKLVKIEWDGYNFDIVKSINTTISSIFGVSNFQLYNKKIGFEIPAELLRAYLNQRHDYTNFVIEVVPLKDPEESQSQESLCDFETIPEPIVEETSPQREEEKQDDRPPAKKAKTKPHDELQEVLETPEGMGLCRGYDLHHRLNDVQRSALVKLLITHEIKKILMLDEPLTVSNERYLYLANSIAKRFPGENPKFYYHEPHKNLVSLAIGSLLEEFVLNKCQYLRDVKDSRYYESGKSVELDFPEVRELVGLKSDWQLYFQAWQQTFPLRMLYIEIIEDPLKYYSKFIRSNDFEWVKLIEDDFERLHPGKGKRLLDNWDQISERIFTEALVSCRNDVPLILDVYGNVPQLSSFMMFSYFLENYDGDDQPFRKDNLRNLVIHIDTVTDDPVEEIREYATKRTGREPRVFVTGGNADELRSYVSVDDSVYFVDSVLKAVDICFKCYHVLHLPYIREQKEPWELIEYSVYDFRVDKSDVERHPFLDVLRIT